MIEIFPGIKIPKWATCKAPTMEITTCIPTKGCIVDCIFCPQRLLQQKYQGERYFSIESFRTLIDKIPSEIRITFAGFTEPWLNKNCTDMLLYAHEKGHPISVFTTAVGMSVEDVERIKNVPFAGPPNGGFTLHLPDEEGLAKHPISKRYLEVLSYIKSVENEIQNFSIMSMGEVHNSVKHIYYSAATHEMWARSGNLMREAILRPEIFNVKDRFKSVYHGEKPMTCKCEERLYHNVLLPNGDVSLCCMDYGLDHILGNLNEKSYDEVIPDPFACFNICRYCENGISPDNIDSEKVLFKIS